ncbi:hypothetical protein LSTR_LSTR011122 [Laodelphax striatellus]|uniref:Annexin n=1 Tax=Laodelphax striatellus TaxID=195883 RepID=A0A482XHC1_LAOST|nr:hypothetical protein LSTR_LSTR011122 [Laodelphax striatellus]
MSTLIMLSTLLIFMWSLKYGACCAPPVVPTTNTTVAQPGVPTILSKPIDVKQEAVNVNLFVSKKDMDGIAKLLAAKTNEQRQRIKVEYQQEYAHSLEEDVAGKTKKTFERLMEALLQPLPEFMARMINWSLNENKNWLYVSILCTSSGELIKQISDAYYAAFKKQLMDELTMKLNDVDGSRFLTSVVNYMAGNNTNENWPGPRPDTTKVAENLVKTQINYIPDRQGKEILLSSRFRLRRTRCQHPRGHIASHNADI